MRFIFTMLLISLILIGCTENELYYPETETIETQSANKIPFTYTPSEDTTDHVWQNIWHYQNFFLLQSGKYLYITLGNCLYRYNTETGNVTNCCADPLCQHNTSDCPFYDQPRLLSAFDDRIYYMTSEKLYDRNGIPIKDENGDIVVNSYTKVYHVETQEVTISERYYSNPNTRTINDYCTEDYEFYYDYIQDTETEEWKRTLFRYDVKTKKTHVLRDVNSENIMAFIKHEDDRLYYCDQISIGWLDIYTGEKHTIYEGDCTNVSCDNEFFYFYRTSDDSLWRVNLTGGEPQSLGVTDAKGDTYITDNYMYFRYNKYNEVGRDETGSPLYLEGQEIWRMNKDGSNKELVYKFEGEHARTTIMSPVIMGNYIYGYWYKYDDNNNQYSTSNPNDNSQSNLGNDSSLLGTILRIDMTTGEHYYIEIYS